MASRAKLTLSERAQAEMRRPYERLSGSSRCASSVIVLKALKASSKRIVLPYLYGWQRQRSSGQKCILASSRNVCVFCTGCWVTNMSRTMFGWEKARFLISSARPTLFCAPGRNTQTRMHFLVAECAAREPLSCTAHGQREPLVVQFSRKSVNTQLHSCHLYPGKPGEMTVWRPGGWGLRPKAR